MNDMQRQDRQWKMIQMLIDADLQGKPVHPTASKRTLFGIKSTVEQVMAEQED